MAREKPELPGMEGERIPAVESLAEAYLRLRKERMATEVKERDKRDLLLAKMKELKITHYEFDEQVVTIDAKEKVFVRAKKEEDVAEATE